MKTYSNKPSEVVRKWYVLDASEAPLGRLSTVAARLLIGKDKVSHTPHVDDGDFVIVINADSLVVTGNKLADKTYYWHSGFPGGIYKKSLLEVAQQDATTALRHAIRGMLPVNKLRDGRLQRLKIYEGENHQHAAQQPQSISLKKGKS